MASQQTCTRSRGIWTRFLSILLLLESPKEPEYFFKVLTLDHLDNKHKFTSIYMKSPGLILLIIYLALIFFAPQERYSWFASMRPMFTVGIMTLIFSLIQKNELNENNKKIYIIFLTLIFIFLLSSFLSPLSNSKISPALFLFSKQILLMILLIKLVNTENDIYLIISAISILGAIVCVYTLFAYKIGLGDIYYRMRSSFGGMGSNSNGFAMFLLGLLPLYIIFFIEKRRFQKKIFYAIIIACVLMCIIKTRSRMGFIGILFIFAIIALEYRKNIKVVAILSLFLIMSLYRASDNFWNRVNTINTNTSNISIYSSDRKNKWRQAIVLIKKYPLLGVGLSKFREGVRYHNLGEDLHIVHNAYLEVGAETGLFGLSFFLSSLLFCIRENIKSLKIFKKMNNIRMYIVSKFLIVSLVSFAFSMIFLSEHFNTMLYILFGLSLALKNIRIQNVANYSK